MLSRTTQSIQVRSSSTNIRPPYSLPQLAEHPVEHTHDWELREHWIGLRVRVYGIFPHTAQPIQVRSSSTNIRSSFKRRSFHSLPQLAEHPIEHTHDWELREYWIGLRARCFLARLSRFKFGALSRTYDHPIAFLNWPSIQLNTHITRNRANYRIRLRVRFCFFPHTAQPIQIQSFSTNIRSPYNLSQLAEHPIEHTHDWELREHWIGLRARFSLFSSYGSADLSSELFH